jgi:hypothetical protein
VFGDPMDFFLCRRKIVIDAVKDIGLGVSDGVFKCNDVMQRLDTVRYHGGA